MMLSNRRVSCHQDVDRRPRRGTTILELLTVAAIIALLISIMLPGMRRARMLNKRSVCIAHLKGIATGSRAYEADDPNGWGIPVHPRQYTQDTYNPTFIGAYEWGGKSGIGRPDFVPAPAYPPNLGSKYGTLAGFGPASRPMNDMLYPGGLSDYTTPWDRAGAYRDTQLELDLFHCPADENPPRAAHCPDWTQNSERSSYDHFGNSYAANVFMTASGAGGEMSSNSPYMRPISRVPTPPRTLIYEENIGRWAWACRREYCDYMTGIDPGPTKALAGWHGKDWAYNRAFVDGHAEYQTILFQGTEDSDGYYLHYKAEHLSHYPGCTGTENCFSYYRCLIVRGPGWQKDTLPAAQVPTGLWSPGGGRPSYEDCVSE